MFESLKPQPPDALLALIKLFRDDPRAQKLDLGVGVYRDEAGGTPIMRAVKAAEMRLHAMQDTKAYLGPEGDLRFVELLRPVVFGERGDFGGRLAGIQTPGGSGALRLGAELIARAKPGATLWLGKPTWPNHAPVLTSPGLKIAEYPFFDVPSQTLLFGEMMAALEGAKAGDVVLLHGCCHNPTGADLDEAQWEEVAALVARKGLVPFIDLAYQGLGLGMESDAQGTRRVLDAVPEALVAYSCDKNFALYRERTGALYVLGKSASEAPTLLGNMAALARVNWSMPPDHGAAAVRIVLEDEALHADWAAEIEEMGARINAVREALAAADPALSFVAQQRGLFSNLPLSSDQVQALRRDHAIYMAGSGRINVAGLRVADAPVLAKALRAVGFGETRVAA